ncbi:hypothetical protein R3X27_14235 [Tropicimonas sp. TH_r6]|uniref:hypothetical protein n=1 Tax=Tropicimonas sp. TH_r6 TaxID=3082085 RepID=UPI00295448DD|nr:hypothetical protein [Tropicimonas sp. TH_r6]MDV7143842.1 hypothetical protein [Tropicimonas sp. TH_r6]
MYHASISIPAPADWKDSLSRGDIVLFAFPLTRPRDDDYPQIRPCLILDVSDLFGARVAQIAYGTSSRTMATTGYDFPVDPAKAP